MTARDRRDAPAGATPPAGLPAVARTGRAVATVPDAPSDSFAGLPELLAEIAGVAGLDAAMAIADARGGAKAHFPASCGDDHWLTRAVGREAADKLCDHFRVNHRGGVSLMVPLGPRRFYSRARLRARELRKTHSIRETATMLGVTTRAVEQWSAADRRDDDRQGRLF